MSTQTDAVTAYLAEVRERSERPLPHVTSLPIGHDGVRALMESAADVPRLAAALEKALELHKPESGGLHGHPGLRVCGRCSSASGAQVWPCYEYEAISGALLGEGG